MGLKCRNMVSNQPNALRAPVCDTLRNKPRCLKRLLTFIEILLNGIFCSRVALIAIKTKQNYPINKDFLFVRQSTKTSSAANSKFYFITNLGLIGVNLLHL